MGQSGLDQNPICDNHLLVDLGQGPPFPKPQYSYLLNGNKDNLPRGHCEKRMQWGRGLGPGLAHSRCTEDRSPSFLLQAPIPPSCRAALLSLQGQVCTEGNYPGHVARAPEHLTRDLIPEQSVTPGHSLIAGSPHQARLPASSLSCPMALSE